MICPRCGQELTQDHQCPTSQVDPQPQQEFIDLYLVQIHSLDRIEHLKQYLMKLLPHISIERIDKALAQLPIVLLRSQPKPRALIIQEQLASLGAQVQLKSIGPATTQQPVTQQDSPAQQQPTAQPTPQQDKKTDTSDYRINPVWAVLMLLILTLISAILLKHKLPLWLSLDDPQEQIQAIPDHNSGPVSRLPEQPLNQPDLKRISAKLPDEQSKQQNKISKNPAHDQINQHREIARGHYEKGRYQRAYSEFQKALALAPESEGIKIDISTTLSEMAWQDFKQGDYDQAAYLFEKSLSYNPGNDSAVHGMGYTEYQFHDLEQAQVWLGKYFDMGGDNADAYALLGRIHYDNNQHDQALTYLRMALKLNPSQTGIRQLIQKIERDLKIEDEFWSEDTRHFVVKYEGLANLDAGNIIIVILEEAYFKIGGDLGYYPENLITAIIYTGKQFQDAARAPDWAGALYDGKIRIPAGGLRESNPMIERIIFHEYVHALLRERTRNNIPTWLNEGLAQYYEGDPLPAQQKMIRLIAKQPKLPPLKALEGSFTGFSKNQAQMVYTQSLLAVQYLRDRYSRYVIEQLLDELARGKSMEQAIERTFSMSYEQFDEQLLEWIKEQYGQ